MSDPADDPVSVEALAANCSAAARTLSTLSTETKNRALRRMAEALEAAVDDILEANERDVAGAREDGLSDALLDRLALSPKRIEKMADALRDVASFPDPVGEMSGTTRRPSGIEVGCMRIPLGVIGMIYEARPNVTADAAGSDPKVTRGMSHAMVKSTRVSAPVGTDMP